MTARWWAVVLVAVVSIIWAVLLLSLTDRSGLTEGQPSADPVVHAALEQRQAVDNYLTGLEVDKYLTGVAVDEFLAGLHAEEHRLKAVAESKRRAAVVSRTVTGTTVSAGSGRCGGDLPPCWVMQRESGGSPTAWNPTGCYERKTGKRGCGGKWQFSWSTWARYGGYETGNLAPEAVQDERARQVWAGGRGCSHWAAC